VADKAGGVYIEIQARMGSLEKDLRSLKEKLDNTNSSFGKMDGIAKRIGGYFTAGAIATGLYQIGKASLSAAANMEQQKVAFTSMLGSAEKAQKLLDQMQAFAASTPFQFNEIVDAGKKLVAFGEDAENVTKTLGRIGDVAAGLGVPLGELTEIYGKARVQQTLYAEDLNQLAGRGIPIFEELAKVMNVNASEVKKLGSEGKISFSLLEQVFKNMTSEGGKFAGLMDAQSKTLAGKWSNFNDQLDKTAVLLGQKMAPAAGDVLGIFSNMLSILNESLSATEDLEKETSVWASSLQSALDTFGGFGIVRAQFAHLKEANAEYDKIKAEQDDYRKKVLNAIEEHKNKKKKASDEEKKQTDDQKKAATDKWKKITAEAEKYYDTVRGIATGTDDPVKQVENEIAALNEGMNKVSDMYKNGEIKKKQYEDTLASYSEARIKKEEELEQAKFDKVASMYSAVVGVATTFSGQLAQLSQMSASNRTAEIDNELQQQQDALQEKYDNDVEAINNSIASQAEKDARLKALDEQKARDDKALATKADKEKRKIAREAAKQQKALSMFDILITTPQAALNAFTGLAKYNIIAAGVAAAAATGLGLAQLKLVADQPLPALAEGGIVPAIPGGRTVQVAEAGSPEAVIPLNDRGVEVIKNIIGTAEPQVNLHVYINDDYKGLYKASKDGYVTIDKRAVV
jgi:tape measure domain-containing protein